MLVLEGLVGLHRTVQLQLLKHYWSGHRLGLPWYWMVCLGNEPRSFCCLANIKYIYKLLWKQNLKWEIPTFRYQFFHQLAFAVLIFVLNNKDFYFLKNKQTNKKTVFPKGGGAVLAPWEVLARPLEVPQSKVQIWWQSIEIQHLALALMKTFSSHRMGTGAAPDTTPPPSSWASPFTTGTLLSLVTVS